MKFRKHRRKIFKRYEQLEQSNVQFTRIVDWSKLKKYEKRKNTKKKRLLKFNKKIGLISLPSNIDFNDNINGIELLISKFKHSSKLSSSTINIDLSKLNNISINGLLYLISEIDILRKLKYKKRKQQYNIATNIKFRYNSKYGINKNNNKLKYLLFKIGYWDYFDIIAPYSINEKTKKEYFLSIKSDTISKSKYVADLRNFISREVHFIKDDIIQDYFDDAITEAMANSVEHGYIKDLPFKTKGKWWLCGHYDSSLKYLKFSFMDYGAGLRETLEYNASDKIKSWFRNLSNMGKSDADIIKMLVNDNLPKYKGKKDKIRGYGFKRFKEFAKHVGYDSEMEVISGSGKYHYSYCHNDKKESESITTMNFSIHGFLISWKIQLGDRNEE